MRRSIRLVVVLMLAGAVPGWSKDFGQQGAVFPVIEADLLAVIEARLRNAEAGGKIGGAVGGACRAEVARRVEEGRLEPGE